MKKTVCGMYCIFHLTKSKTHIYMKVGFYMYLGISEGGEDEFQVQLNVVIWYIAWNSEYQQYVHS